jgi:hypothetical protein
MKNRDDVKDKSPARWLKDKPYHYPETDMERVCWDIVDLAERLHLYGLGHFPIYDKATYDNLKKDSQLTFQQRMELRITSSCFYKSKYDAVLKGEGVELLVADPCVKLDLACGNHKRNVRRGEQERLGRTVMRERVKAPSLTRADATEIGDEDLDEHKAGADSDHLEEVICIGADLVTATPEPHQKSCEDSVMEDPPKLTISLAETKRSAEDLNKFRACKRMSPGNFVNSEPKHALTDPSKS